MEQSKNPIHITILSGGIGAERDVSLNSGTALAEALKDHYSVDLIDLKESKVPQGLDPRETVVFPVIHGTFGEDGSLQSMLEEQGFIYAGSDCEGSRLCMDKVRTKQVVQAEGVRVAKDIFFTEPNKLDLKLIHRELGPDLILKPTDQGSSVALYVLKGIDDLQNALSTLPSGNWMLEQRVFGREFTVGVLRDMSLGIVEVIPKGGVYDYERKYTPGSTDYKYPAIIPLSIEEEVKRQAVDCFRACGCRDFARIDFIVCEDGNPHFLEVNTLPGLTSTSLLPKSASCSGYDFSALVKELLRPAISRFTKLNLLPAA
tara:strand:+ start:672 stop:1619 length:948 start_codon:yes stop_codon:yes gene_type:complete